MQSDKEMLHWVQFITDKFADNHKPWKYTRDTSSLVHLRYTSDTEGHNYWTERLKRYLKDIKPGRYKRDKALMVKWDVPYNYRSHLVMKWKVGILPGPNAPDAMVNGNIFHWDEDAEYVTMFCPYVGREVLKFLNAEPDNEHAKRIMAAMQEVSELNWPSEQEEK